jgi:anti-sigma regulatory factor (Ser/Thr protein kinase)
VDYAALTLPAEPRSASLARRFVTETLTDWDADGFTWDASVIVSELTTNAVLHARTRFTVTLSLLADVLRIEVADGSTRVPIPRDYGRQATTGRGLAMLGALTRAHGVHATHEGKTVWCELVPDTPDQRSPDTHEVPSVPAQPSDETWVNAMVPVDRPGAAHEA